MKRGRSERSSVTAVAGSRCCWCWAPSGGLLLRIHSCIFTLLQCRARWPRVEGIGQQFPRFCQVVVEEKGDGVCLVQGILPMRWCVVDLSQRRQEPVNVSLADEGSICLDVRYCALEDFSIRVMRSRLPTESSRCYGRQSCALSDGSGAVEMVVAGVSERVSRLCLGSLAKRVTPRLLGCVF